MAQLETLIKDALQGLVGAQLVKASAYVRMWEDELQKADAAQQKLATQNNFIDGLRRQSEAIGKSRADLLELQAAQMGVSTQAAPFIAALRQQEQSLGTAGISAGQLSMALRSVPMQFTDIVTSIAAGQSPMMVLLQQGGHLKDMFGGAGAAARALGG